MREERIWEGTINELEGQAIRVATLLDVLTVVRSLGAVCNECEGSVGVIGLVESPRLMPHLRLGKPSRLSTTAITLEATRNTTGMLLCIKTPQARPHRRRHISRNRYPEDRASPNRLGGVASATFLRGKEFRARIRLHLHVCHGGVERIRARNDRAGIPVCMLRT